MSLCISPPVSWWRALSAGSQGAVYTRESLAAYRCFPPHVTSLSLPSSSFPYSNSPAPVASAAFLHSSSSLPTPLSPPSLVPFPGLAPSPSLPHLYLYPHLCHHPQLNPHACPHPSTNPNPISILIFSPIPVTISAQGQSKPFSCMPDGWDGPHGCRSSVLSKTASQLQTQA